MFTPIINTHLKDNTLKKRHGLYALNLFSTKLKKTNFKKKKKKGINKNL